MGLLKNIKNLIKPGKKKDGDSADLEGFNLENDPSEEELEEITNQYEYIRDKLKSDEFGMEDYARELGEANKQINRKKLEYEQVTAYLTDIQLIDQMGEEDKEAAVNAAFKIAALTKDRDDLKQEQGTLTDRERRFIELHEYEIEDGLTLMEDQEKYQSDIRGDLSKLNQEMNNLVDEERYYLQKLNNFRMISYSIIFLAIIASGIIAMLYTMYEFDILLDILLILTLVAVTGAIIFVRYRKVNYALKYCRKQQAKAAKLTNKVKVKWVNNQATLDYIYSKYNVMSSGELRTMLEQYKYLLENEQMYLRSSKELNLYETKLIKLLQNLGVHDAEIWVNQPEAIIDPREMVEVTHGLNMRRAKLREDIKNDEDIIDLATALIKSRISSNPEEAIVAQRVLETYRISIPV